MEKIMKYLGIVVFACLICSCATKYEAIGATGGFYHTKVSDNVYLIGFRGNGFTDAKRANDFALLRAAEIGSKLGFTHFVVEGTLDKSKTEIINTSSTTNSSGNIYSYGNKTSFNGTSTTTNNTMPVYKPGVEIGVLYSEGIPQGRHLEIYEVEKVISEIKSKYKINP